MYVGAVIPSLNEPDADELAMTLIRACDSVEIVTEPGLGPAYLHGWDAIDPSWWIVHIDAGGSHDPADVYPMLELAEEGFDVVIGSRFVRSGEHHGPWRRRVTSRLAAAALNLISLQDISDWTSGYRVYSPKARAAIKAHTFTTTGHAWQIEALWVCLQAGCRIVEHPIVYRSSVSHLSSGRVREAAALYWRLAGE